MTLELIEWIDSHGCSSEWQDRADAAEQPPVTVRSVGWIISEGDKAVIVAPHIMARTGHVCGTMTIPKAAITSRKPLEPAVKQFDIIHKEFPGEWKFVEEAHDGNPAPVTKEEFAAKAWLAQEDARRLYQQLHDALHGTAQWGNVEILLAKLKGRYGGSSAPDTPRSRDSRAAPSDRP